MKAVILAGGLGTRIYEETAVKPKPSSRCSQTKSTTWAPKAMWQ